MSGDSLTSHTPMAEVNLQELYSVYVSVKSTTTILTCSKSFHVPQRIGVRMRHTSCSKLEQYAVFFAIGAFLIPYIIVLVFVGKPMYFMELAFGQYHAEGPVNVWKKSVPFARGTKLLAANN